MYHSMSIEHALSNGLLVTCSECKLYSVPYDCEPCKTCLENQRRSLDQDIPLQCFFESKTPEEHEKMAKFLDEHKDIIRELYRDSIVLDIPMSKLASIWKYRDVLRKYCGDKPPIDIFKEAKKQNIPIANFEFQIHRNIRLLTGKAPHCKRSE